MNIDRTKDRIKQTGEVFTPLPLVDEILDKLPPEIFTDPTKTFIDPSCGNGNFLVQVIQRKHDNGSTWTHALHTTYGIDLMPDNIEGGELEHNKVGCKERLLKLAGDTPHHREFIDNNIICADALKFNFSSLQPVQIIQQEIKMTNIKKPTQKQQLETAKKNLKLSNKNLNVKTRN